MNIENLKRFIKWKLSNIVTNIKEMFTKPFRQTSQNKNLWRIIIGVVLVCAILIIFTDINEIILFLVIGFDIIAWSYLKEFETGEWKFEERKKKYGPYYKQHKNLKKDLERFEK